MPLAINLQHYILPESMFIEFVRCNIKSKSIFTEEMGTKLPSNHGYFETSESAYQDFNAVAYVKSYEDFSKVLDTIMGLSPSFYRGDTMLQFDDEGSKFGEMDLKPYTTREDIIQFVRDKGFELQL